MAERLAERVASGLELRGYFYLRQFHQNPTLSTLIRATLGMSFILMATGERMGLESLGALSKAFKVTRQATRGRAA